LTLKAVLIGAGNIGHAHLQAISRIEGLSAAAVADISPEKAGQSAAAFGIAAYTEYRKMLSELRPDIAIIALPHFLHRDAAVACMEAGCHVLLEKPMAVSSAECDDIIACADRLGRIVLVGHTQQYLPWNLAAKALMRKEAASLGKLIQINDSRYGPYFTEQRPAWFLDRAKSGGGIVANLGAHAVDKIQWLTDSRIRSVRANLSFEAPGYPDIEGSASMLLMTESGVSCTVNLGGYEGIRKHETELLFTGGMIRIHYGGGLWISRGGECERIPVAEETDPYELQLVDLIDCIRSGRQPYASGRYGKSVVRAIETIYASHAGQCELEVIV